MKKIIIGAVIVVLVGATYFTLSNTSREISDSESAQDIPKAPEEDSTLTNPVVEQPADLNSYKIESVYPLPNNTFAPPESQSLVYYNANGEKFVLLENLSQKVVELYGEEVPNPNVSSFFLISTDSAGVTPINNNLYLRASRFNGGTDALFPVYLYSFNTESGKLKKLNPDNTTIYWNAFIYSPDGNRVAIKLNGNTKYDRLLVFNMQTNSIERDILLGKGETMVFSESELSGHERIPIRWINNHTLEYKVYPLPEPKTYNHPEWGTYQVYSFPYRYSELFGNEDYQNSSGEEKAKFHNQLEDKYALRIETIEFE
ncbi:MAG: hypothetical protein R3B52_00675 [Candidatus Paceibacterota bacterium]